MWLRCWCIITWIDFYTRVPRSSLNFPKRHGFCDGSLVIRDTHQSICFFVHFAYGGSISRVFSGISLSWQLSRSVEYWQHVVDKQCILTKKTRRHFNLKSSSLERKHVRMNENEWQHIKGASDCSEWIQRCQSKYIQICTIACHEFQDKSIFLTFTFCS